MSSATARCASRRRTGASTRSRSRRRWKRSIRSSRAAIVPAAAGTTTSGSPCPDRSARGTSRPPATSRLQPIWVTTCINGAKSTFRRPRSGGGFSRPPERPVERHLAVTTRRFLVSMLLLFTVLTAVMTYPQIFHMNDGVHDEGDPLLVTWVLGWVAHQLPRAPAHLFDANIFYPERNTLAYSETLLLPGTVAAPLFWLGIGPILIYNLVFLSGSCCPASASRCWSAVSQAASGR